MSHRWFNLLFWTGVVFLILYLSWGAVEPLISALFFGVTLAYIFYPLYRRIKIKTGPRSAALLLTIVVIFLGGAFLAGMALVSLNLLQTFYRSVGDIFTWLLSINLPPSVENFVQNFRINLMPLLAEQISSFTFSAPRYLLQLFVALFTFYYSLVYSEDFVPLVLRLAPQKQRDFVLELLTRLDKTMNALVRAWLLLNVAKSFLMTLGYLLFGVSDLYTAIIAGFLTFVFSFVPLLEGWMLWVAAAIYLYLKGSPLLALGIAIYGAVLVSPLPDYTIRPMLVARDADLDETLVFIGMLGGTWAFGLKGLLIGPIVLNMALVVLKEWKRMRGIQMEEHSTTSAPAS
jgi:predicted PurR-regulated permease PerM